MNGKIYMLIAFVTLFCFLGSQFSSPQATSGPPGCEAYCFIPAGQSILCPVLSILSTASCVQYPLCDILHATSLDDGWCMPTGRTLPPNGRATGPPPLARHFYHPMGVLLGAPLPTLDSRSLCASQQASRLAAASQQQPTSRERGLSAGGNPLDKSRRHPEAAKGTRRAQRRIRGNHKEPKAVKGTPKDGQWEAKGSQRELTKLVTYAYI